MPYRRLLLIFLLCLLGFGGVIHAQDALPTEPLPTEIPTDIPAEAATAIPTDVPTEVVTDAPTEQPTEAVTDAPTEQPTEAATEQPTETPTSDATVEVTETPTEVVNLPPQFSLDGSVALEATSGTLTTFTLAVADEDGLVTIGRADNISPAAIVITQAAEAVAAETRFYTAVSIDYTAPADFSGTDSFTLVAVDRFAASTTLTLTVNVTPPIPEATLEPTPEPTKLPDQIRIINYSPTASEASIQAMLTALGAVEISRIPQIGAMKVYISQMLGTTSAAVSALNAPSVNAAARAAGVTSIEPEIIYQTAAFPNDTLYPHTIGSTTDQWALADYSAGTPGGINAPAAWSISVKDGLGVTVAVLDTGIDTTHPDLTGKLLPGWNFVSNSSNTDDDVGHGTLIAGIIAANTNNGKGIAGIAFNAKLLPVRVCETATVCSSYDIAAGLVYATDKGAKVANLSLGSTSKSTTLEGAVKYALYKNVVVVAAAGDTGTSTDFYPASYENVISVAAHDIDGIHAALSTANLNVTVSAPGVNIVSTYPPDIDPDHDGYFIDSGTSMAAPMVSGVIALMISDKLVSTPAAAREALICSAYDSVGDGYDQQEGHGLLQADLAQNWNQNSPGCHVTVPNDLYQNATNIPTVPFSTTQLIHTRSVTSSPSDPYNAAAAAAPCDAPEQTLWYKFKPTVSDYYQITTVGSTYDTQVSVWQLPEEGNTSTNFIGCNDQGLDILTDASVLGVSLTAAQTYYIMVDSYDVADDEILRLDIRRGISTINTDIQETSSNIFYFGTWAQTTAAGASGGQVKMTTDDNGLVMFSFRGTALDIARTVGPTQGDMLLLIDGVPAGPIFNRAAVLKRNQSYHIDLDTLCGCGVDASTGRWHQAVLIPASTGMYGPIDIDRIRVYDTYNTITLPTVSITALTDDSLGSLPVCTAKKFCYTDGTFTIQNVTGANMGKVTQTIDPGATVTFRATGSTITIYRTTNLTFGSMDVKVDGVVVGDDVSNESADLHAKVPYVISGLSPVGHVVQIINNVSSTLQFDAAMASTPAAIPASTTAVNDNAPNLVYSGYWENQATPGTLGNTIRKTSEVGASVSFNYTGNWFLLGYRMASPQAQVNIYVDNQLVTPDPLLPDPLVPITLPGGGVGTLSAWDSRTLLNLQSDRTHSVRIVLVSGTLELDSVGARRQAIITPSMGLVQETNTAVRYDTAYGTWTTTTQKSLGGAAFQGNSAKRTNASGARLSFYINGTGFLLYTSIGPVQDGWDVYVDGTLFNPELDGVTDTFIQLNTSANPRPGNFRPLPYGITGLTPGIHLIELRKHGVNTNPVDFDGVRVFP